MTDWYYAINGEQYGPVSDRVLHDLAGDGSIQPTDLVWKEGFADWQEASSVAGLFPNGPVAPSSPPPPIPPSLQSTVPGDRVPRDSAPLDEIEVEPVGYQPPPSAASAPNPYAAYPHPPAGAWGGRTPDDLKVPLLVSGICNIVVGLIWTMTCFGVIFAIPMAILAAYELSLYNKADRIPTDEFASGTRKLAIYQIILGIFNTPTLVCGIILMVQSGKYEHPRGIAA